MLCHEITTDDYHGDNDVYFLQDLPPLQCLSATVTQSEENTPIAIVMIVFKVGAEHRQI